MAAWSGTREWLEQDEAERREMFIQDQRGAISLAAKKALKEGLEKGREEGLEKGLEKGREEGLEKGREEGLEKGRKEGLEQGQKEGLESAKMAIAQKLLATMGDQQIADLTGLTLNQIQGLRSFTEHVFPGLQQPT